MTVVSRREMLAGVAAASALGAAMPALRLAPSSLFLYDARLDATGLIRAAAGRAGSRIVSVTSGLGELAYQFDREPVWRTAVVAGLTMPAVTFIFEQLALRRSMRVVRHDRYVWSTAAGRSVGVDALHALETAQGGRN